MNSIRIIVLATGFLFFALSATAQVPELINDPAFREDAKVAVDSVYNFNFESAEQKLQPWKEQYPDHPLWSLFEGMQLWWTVLSDLNDHSHDREFIKQMKKTDYVASKLLHDQSKHVDGLLIKAISNGYTARQYANREKWISSINYGREAIKAYNYLLDVQPNLKDLKLAEGLKLYYLDYIPDRYPAVKTVSWAMPNGNQEKGLQFIRRASKEGVFARAEATYFLGNINYNYEKEFDIAVRHFEELYEQYPHNNYYVRILVKSYYRQQQFANALQVIEESVNRWEKKELPHKGILKEELLTWKGRILEQEGNKNEALTCFKKAFEISKKLPNTQSRPFYVVSGYYAGKLLHEEGSTEQAKSYLKNVVQSNVKKSYREQANELIKNIK
ncbi:tetratricopeptide repeat protein [Fodinibius sp. Rm-B-1B1-1]|uniref:tetratricopeptide repeat protein n=1 Tax=Fodinibius alkaliphilus TaxID=3140241 RepID=UPI00315B0D25